MLRDDRRVASARLGFPTRPRNVDPTPADIDSPRTNHISTAYFDENAYDNFKIKPIVKYNGYVCNYDNLKYPSKRE